MYRDYSGKGIPVSLILLLLMPVVIIAVNFFPEKIGLPSGVVLELTPMDEFEPYEKYFPLTLEDFYENLKEDNYYTYEYKEVKNCTTVLQQPSQTPVVHS